MLLNAARYSEVWQNSVYTHDDMARADADEKLTQVFDAAEHVGMSAGMSADYMDREGRSPGTDEPVTVHERNLSKRAQRYADSLYAALENARSALDALTQIEAIQRREAVDRAAEREAEQMYARFAHGGKLAHYVKRLARPAAPTLRNAD